MELGTSDGGDALPPHTESEDNEGQVIAVDNDMYAVDSGVEASDINSSYATSLLSEVQNYKYENGRRYHSYREGQYLLPNDEMEQDRQDLLHHVRNLTFNGRLFRSPLKDNIQCVLDIGTGTGIWAIDFADAYPSTKVIGTDLSPIQPSWVPPNLQFYVDDAESVWMFQRESFDFIHVRELAGAIDNWPKLISQAYENLRPGGWIELQDFESYQADDDSLKFAPRLAEWTEYLRKAGVALKRTPRAALLHEERLEEAGFTNIRVEIFKIPMSSWPKDERLKEIGRYNLPAMLMSIDSYSIALFSRIFGWSQLEIQVYLSGIRKELKNPYLHAYNVYYVVYGQKPEEKK